MNRRKVCMGMAACLLMLCLHHIKVVYAKESAFTLKQMQNLAISNDQDYKKILTKIELQQVKYASAVKTIKMKKKNMLTFRWTPLLSFKFPENPSLSDEYEWVYKPLQITCTIKELQHQLKDEELAAKEEISLLYVDAYLCQEKIAFWQDTLEHVKKTLERNRIRLAAGEAAQSDLDKLEKSAENLQSKLTLQMRTLEATVSKMSRLTGLTIDSGCTFKNPFVEANISRDLQSQLVQYTMERNQGLYEAKLETQLSLTSLNTIENLMESQYGRSMEYISGYIRQIKNGGTVDEREFKLSYNEFLKAVDGPWEGKKKILFIRIPRVWFKGETDGSRYVEDDPYALYTEALEYADARKNLEDVEAELKSSLEDGFEALITARNAYESAEKNCQEAEKAQQKAAMQNQLGEVSLEELRQQQEAYEESQIDTLELLGEYSKLLYSYDRFTCGGISAYLNGETQNVTGVSGGISYLEAQKAEGAFYYIESRVEDHMFLLRVSIPEDFSVELSHFALYVDGTRIGNKTPVNECLYHLALDLESAGQVELYLYQEETLKEICEINAQEYQGELEITDGYRMAEQETERAVADFSYTIQQTTKTATIQFTKKQGEAIAGYQIREGTGEVMLSETIIPIQQPFTYLELLAHDFSKLQVLFYDDSGTLLYTGTFRESTAEVVAAVEEGREE